MKPTKSGLSFILDAYLRIIIMFFYIDESGHTGNNLFDSTQPYLYYGVLGSQLNLDILAEPEVRKMRKILGVEDRLHAAELGETNLVKILPDLYKLSKDRKISFDFYRLDKSDYPVLCFFDLVFDQGINPAMTWSGYWTPLRYVLLAHLDKLFTTDLKKLAWSARLESKDSTCDEIVQNICNQLLDKLHKIDDKRLNELFHDTLSWAIHNTRELSFNAKSKRDKKFISPNLIGFQSAYFGIVNRSKKAKRKVFKVTIDQQDQFNTVQDYLAEIYRKVEGESYPIGFNIGEMDLTKTKMPLPSFSSSKKSYGLELVDLYLWLFKRYQEGKLNHPALIQFVNSQFKKAYFDEVSIKATTFRFEAWMRTLEPMTEEDYKRGLHLKQMEENRRKSFLV